MTYFTGDIHGSPWKIVDFCEKMKLTETDTIIILGDVGANYYGNERDDAMKQILSRLTPSILCIHGNHEQRPWNIKGYKQTVWSGGKVWRQSAYPNLLLAVDGEIYNISGIRYLAIGGAYSVDKFYRLDRGYGWWADEQPSAEIKAFVEQQIKRLPVDVVLSHTCPFHYEPTEVFLPMINQSTVDDSTERWLDTIEEFIEYKAWFCGHWHTDKRIDKMHFLFDSFESDEWLHSKTEGK